MSKSCVNSNITQETGLHLFTECSFTKTIWAEMGAWTRCTYIDPGHWDGHESLHIWWTTLASTQVANRKGLRSLIILVLWEIWTERNARIFQNKEQMIHRMANKIKDQAATWIAAGAKHLESFINVVRDL
uniref:Reverse transcriptase zinc-binding domain-containing protein n=1 Tax=Setaria viridis TaxID=4556 RepID=A0A4V6D140_SETVI|nr:hypothetical protein SEVIR_9G210300v2 [Setaria viridis]